LHAKSSAFSFEFYLVSNPNQKTIDFQP